METRRATEGSAGVLDSTSRSPTGRNAVDMPGSAAEVESWREMRVSLPLIFLAATLLTAGNVDGLERGNHGKRGKIAITMKHRQLMPKRAGSDQAVDAGPDR